MIDNDVPLIAYIYVGITSLVLAYVTYNDETNRASGATKSDSSTPILPAFLTGATSGQANSSTSSSGSILPAFMTGESKPAAAPPASSGTPPSNSNNSILPSFMQTGQNSQGAVRGGKKKHTKGTHKKQKSNKSKKSK
jgi:transcription elongation factor